MYKRFMGVSGFIRTIRLLTISQHAMHRGMSAQGGGCLSIRGVCPGGLPRGDGCLLRGVSARGCLPRGVADTLCEWND